MINRGMDKQGFSLLELLIVIAIVAILTTIAYPFYKKQLFASRISSLNPIIGNLLNKMIEYAAINNKFPSMEDLGMGELTNNAKSLSPYLLSVSSADYHGDGTPANCSRGGIIGFIIDHDAVGQTDLAYEQITCYLWHIDGVINKKCFFYAAIPAVGTSMLFPYRTDVVPGMGGQYYDGGGSFRFNSSYGQATCM